MCVFNFIACIINRMQGHRYGLFFKKLIFCLNTLLNGSIITAITFHLSLNAIKYVCNLNLQLSPVGARSKPNLSSGGEIMTQARR